MQGKKIFFCFDILYFLKWTPGRNVLCLVTGMGTGPSSEVLFILFSGWHLSWKLASWDGAPSLLVKGMNDDDLLGTRAGVSAAALTALRPNGSLWRGLPCAFYDVSAASLAPAH